MQEPQVLVAIQTLLSLQELHNVHVNKHHSTCKLLHMLDVNKLENSTARQCDRQVYVHIFLNWLHGPQVPNLKLFSGASPMSCLIFAHSY